MSLGDLPGGSGGARLVALGVTCLMLASCTSSDRLSQVDPRYGVASSPRVIAPGEPVPKGGGTYRVGKPYVVAGHTYVPEENPHYRAEGIASWYGDDFHGRLTANGEIFDMQSLSAAHPTLPLPCYVRVTNLSNNRSVIVRVNDRGPYRQDRLIDVSVRAANLLGFYGSGLAPVRVEYVGNAPLEGSDDQILVATLREGEPAPPPSLVRVASARGFVPEVPWRAGAAREVPIPQDRPYSLGEGQMVSNYRAAPADTAVARAPAPDRDRPVAVNSPGAERARSPVSAYSSSPRLGLQDNSPGTPVLLPASGMRGLY